ncbi:beta strand repeat-containing protein [Novosphingobium aquimarinum]|uniref:beta strand repeat-containing protein n=1 Tax=Novosphingobium aquimarinum TaxID=2682494 RepID=UPI0012EC8290|nr:hypothetical protein [Novosphingobium aquimarinum]
MARNTLFIRSGLAGVPGTGQYEVFGTPSVEVLFVDADADIVLDASFNKGRDTIHLGGAATDYSATLQNANLILTSDWGGTVLVPIGTTGSTIVFDGVGETTDSRVLAITNGAVALGNQLLPTGTTTQIDPAGGIVGQTNGSNGAEQSGERNTLLIRSPEAAVSDVGRYEVFGTTGAETLSIAGNADVVLDASFNKGGDRILIDGLADDYSASLQNANLILTSAGGGRIFIPVGTVGSELVFKGSGDSEDARVLAITDGSVLLGGQVIPFSGAVGVAPEGVIVPPNPSAGLTVALSTGTDIFTGSRGNDIFAAPSKTGSSGTASATLTTGDRLDGSAGEDILIAELPASATTPIQPTTISVETVRISAGAVTPAGGAVPAAIAELDARSMYDVESFASSLSSASLLISHANTLAGGSNGPLRPTEDVEIRMASMAGLGTNAAASDLVVLFDAPYLVATDATRPVTAQVVLDNVGRGSDGGDLLIGATAISNEQSGIERFVVTVLGEASKSSSLASLSTTDNMLRELIVLSETNDATQPGAANAIIGNRATATGVVGNLGASLIGSVPNDATDSACDLTDARNSALIDVALVDGTGFAGNFELHASLTDQVGAKYFIGASNDDADVPTGTMRYLFGTGDDTLNLSVAKFNLLSNATDGDFRVVADMGAGDDTLLLQAGDGTFSMGGLMPAQGVSWYAGHLRNENLSLSTGAGDDFVWTYGATAAVIATGEGDDVIYTDNSGTDDLVSNCGYATWVYNARNLDIDNLASEEALSAPRIANVFVAVTFLGFTSTAVVADSLDSIDGVTVTDLDVNAAIMSAINDDPVLGSLLNAVEGPGRTLTVLSRVDGQYVEPDLAIELTSTPLSAAQTAGASSLFDATQLAAFEARYDSQFAEQRTVVLDGRNSQNLNSNTVEAGAGDDVIVLSSNVSSIETLKISGAFGVDHVANFSAHSLAPTTNETQVFFIDRAQSGQGSVTAVTYSLFGLEPQTIALGENATADQIAQTIAADINARYGDLATATVDSAGTGQNNLVIEADGPDGQGIDFAATTIAFAGSASNGGALPITAVLGDIVDGHRGALGFDIFDLSAVIADPDAPDYFFNGAQQDSDEAGALSAFIDSGTDGVVIIDTLSQPGDGGDAVRLQQLVSSLDDETSDSTAGDDTQSGVIVTVDGQSGTFYQFVNGEAAGDATVTYLGTIRLSDYSAASKDSIGNWDAMTIENFTPLSASQLLDMYTSSIVG